MSFTLLFYVAKRMACGQFGVAFVNLQTTVALVYILLVGCGGVTMTTESSTNTFE